MEAQSVAVIAIHGVGQHPPGASATSVSTSLLSMGRERNPEDIPCSSSAPPYQGFVTTSVDVPLRPVQSPPDEASEANDRWHESWWSGIWGIFDERRGYLAARRQDKPLGYTKRQLRLNEPDRGEYGYQFMLTQLAGYQGEVDRNFQTVRLEGKREGNSSCPTVHIYDAHYSDLSKPESSIVAFFFSFYQLLFHLCSLSLLAVYWAEAENVKVEKESAKKLEEEENKLAESQKDQPKENANRNKPRIWRWRITSSVHATSVRLLTMAIPILNVVLLEIAICAFVDKTYGKAWLPLLACSFAAVLSLGATFMVLRQRSSFARPFFWATSPFLGTALGTAILSGIAYRYVHGFGVGTSFYQTLLLLSWLLTGGLLLAIVAKEFEPLRPGAFALSIVLYSVNVLWFLLYLLPHLSRHAASPAIDSSNQLATASLWAVQSMFGELVIAWTLCLLCALLSWPLSALCKFAIRHDRLRYGRATAAFRTGRFAFAVPAILFVIVTSVLWSGVLVYGSYKLRAFERVPFAVADWEDHSSWARQLLVPKIHTVEAWIGHVENEKTAKNDNSAPTATNASVRPQSAEETSAGGPVTSPITTTGSGPSKSPNDYWTDYLKGLLLVSVTPGLLVTMAIFALAMLLLVWAVLPSIIFEVDPEGVQNATSQRIRWLGEWLSRGLDNTAILTRLLWLAIVPVPLVLFVLDWHTLLYSIPHSDFLTVLGRWPIPGFDHWLLNPASRYTLQMIQRTGLYLAISAAAVFAFVLKNLTTVLDTILDVDNYLRTSPLNRTPRALIAERCTSLLRYIANYRDDQNRPYSKVIIVAHSLGSLVTTDLLRYLERSGEDSPDADLAMYGFRKKETSEGQSKIPICVFSMGSPLRQLLNRFFPHLYWWVSDTPDNSLAPLGAADTRAMPPITSPLPRTDEMNVARWVNAYRSGDYVGRALWVGQWFKRNGSGNTTAPPDVATADPPRSCSEMCIGLGAHTHYWDRSAPEIAAALDRIICGIPDEKHEPELLEVQAI